MAQNGAANHVAAGTPSADTLQHRKKYHIPVRYLKDAVAKVDDSQGKPAHEEVDGPPETPILVFINPKSGGKCGPQLQKLLNQGLGEQQVLDIGDSKQHPDVVLEALYKSLDAAVKDGDQVASHIKKHLRLVAAGGDGTVAWLLSTVRKLNLDPPPPVGVIPLGTGNGISVNLGWGKKTRPRDLKGRKKADKELEDIAKAEIRPIDGWDIKMSAPDGSLIDELPHSVHKVDDKGTEAKGDYWYYCTVGLDAEVAYRFHKLRSEKPWLSPTRKTNIFWYFYSTCRTGWFCCPTPLNTKMTLRQRNDTGGWRDVDIPRTVKAVIFINLQSYTGSRDMWGLHDPAASKYSMPIYDDGKIEVIGLQSAGRSVMALTNLWKRIHGARLAQGSEFQIDLAKSGGGDTHLRLDGEPWRQQVPGTEDGQPLRVHIKLAQNSGRVLVNKDNLPIKNKFSRAAADAAGNSSASRFEADGETVVASKPSRSAQEELKRIEGDSAAQSQHGMHLLTHHTA